MPRLIVRAPSPSLADGEDTGETLRTLVVRTVNPIAVEHDVVYRRATAPRPGLADLATYEPEFGAEGVRAEAAIVMAWTCVGPHGIKVESARLVREVCMTK